MKIRAAEPTDYGEIYTLQLAAYVDEARLYGTPDIPPLKENIDEFRDRLSKCDSWVALDRNRIVGAVSLRRYRGAPDVERLMVAPDRRGESISSALLKVVEHAAMKAGHSTLQLVIGDLAVDNQRIYEHLGWQRTDSFKLAGFEQVVLHNMTKKLAVPTK